MDDNGTGQGGGNSSVWWEMRGSKRRREKPKLANRFRVSTAAETLAAGQPVVDLEDVLHHPGPGEVKIGSTRSGEGRVEGHDTTDFDYIGVSNDPSKPAHPGKFRVSLRFKKELLNDEKLIPGKYRDWIIESAARLRELTGTPADTSKWPEGDVFLVIDVPAIKRKPMPERGEDWKDMPWEIHWEW